MKSKVATVCVLAVVLAIGTAAQATVYTATFSFKTPGANDDWGFDGADNNYHGLGGSGYGGPRPDGTWGVRTNTGAGSWSSAVIGSGTGAKGVHEAVQGFFQGADGYSDAWTTDTSTATNPSTTGWYQDTGSGNYDNDAPKEIDTGFIENLWKFAGVATFAPGYTLTVKADDLDNYLLQKGSWYEGAEDWYVMAKYDGTVHNLGMMPIAPTNENGYNAEATFGLPNYTGGDIIIGIDGTYWNPISKTINPDGSHRPYDYNGGQQHGIQLNELTLAPVPEPASLIIWGLLGAGAAGLGVVRRRRRGATGTPWSEENRQAIRRIVDGGRLNK